MSILDRRLAPVVSAFLYATVLVAPAQAADAAVADAPAVDPAVLARIREAAMHSDWAYQRLADLTDRVGPRLSGSPQAEAAVQQIAATMSALGAKVTLQPVKVPHWVRGAESAVLVDYPGRPAGLTQPLHLTALGASGATPAKGVTAPVLVVHDFAELMAQKEQVRGRIVLFDAVFDQHLADNGHAMNAYIQAGAYRFVGPQKAAELGAAAVLVRSVGGADYRLPHTGQTIWKDGQQPIPAAALSAEDAALVDRLAAQGTVSMHLLLTPQLLPDADSHNVLADWPGREKPDEVVLVSGHLDSWDLGTGAIDDGVGVTTAMGVVQVLQSLQLHPRRSIRVVAWMNEENGGRGGRAYFEQYKDRLATQSAAIESDSGAGRAMGIYASVAPSTVSLLQPVVQALAPLGAGVIERRDGEVGADISPLQKAGVPGFAPLLDVRHYFDYHHTAADTLDKVDPEDTRRQVATMAVLAYYLAEMPEPLPRSPAADGE